MNWLALAILAAGIVFLALPIVFPVCETCVDDLNIHNLWPLATIIMGLICFVILFLGAGWFPAYEGEAK